MSRTKGEESCKRRQHDPASQEPSKGASARSTRPMMSKPRLERGSTHSVGGVSTPRRRPSATGQRRFQRNTIAGPHSTSFPSHSPRDHRIVRMSYPPLNNDLSRLETSSVISESKIRRSTLSKKKKRVESLGERDDREWREALERRGANKGVQESIEEEESSWRRWTSIQRHAYVLNKTSLRHQKGRECFFASLEKQLECNGDLIHSRSVETLPPYEQFVYHCRAMNMPLIPFALPEPCDTELDVSASGLGEEYCHALALTLPAFEGVERVDVSENAIGVWGFKALLDAAHVSGIKSLLASHCLLGRHGAWMVANQLQMRPNDSSILRLDLSGNRFSSYGARLIARALTLNTHLRVLDLSNNAISNDGAKAVASLLLETRTLRCLNLASNGISDAGALSLAVAFERNESLYMLDLAWNNFGKCGAALLIGVALASHPIVRRIDLSYNEVGVDCGLVLAHSFRLNTRLKSLLLNGNPIGSACHALVQTLASGSALRHLELSNCSLRQESRLLNPSSPGGSYVLDMNAPLHVAVASALLSLASRNRAHGACLRRVLLDSLPIELRVDQPRPWRSLPTKGVLQFDLVWCTGPPQTPMSNDAFESVYEALASAGRDGEDEQVFALLDVAYSDMEFLGSQVLRILRLFSQRATTSTFTSDLMCDNVRNHPLRVKAAAMLIMQTIDIDSRDIIISDFSPEEVKMVCQRLHSFDHHNPTAHYLLDLSIKVERTIAVRLAEISNIEKRKRDESGKFDVSQSGNGQMWRNETLDGVPFTFEPTWSIPFSGVLEFDFVVHSRSLLPTSGLLMRADEFDELAEKLFDTMFEGRGLSSEAARGSRSEAYEGALAHLRYASIRRMYLCEQARVLINCFSPLEEDDPDLRAEAFIILYSRIVNEYEARALMHCLPQEGKLAAMHRLGYIALWNPFRPEGDYLFDLKHRDCRLIANALLRLSLVEKDVVLEQCTFNGSELVMPALWIITMPNTGILQFTYRNPGGIVERMRERVALESLGWDQEALATIRSSTM